MLQNLATYWFVYLACSICSFAALMIYSLRRFNKGRQQMVNAFNTGNLDGMFNFRQIPVMPIILWAGFAITGILAVVGCLAALIQWAKS